MEGAESHHGLAEEAHAQDEGGPGASTTRQDTSLVSNGNFKVVVRVRPPVERELEDGKHFQNIVHVDAHQRVLTISENLAAISSGQPGSNDMYPTHTFTFDHCYDQRSEQKHVYDTCAKAAVHSCLKGYNATIIAYGQTGTGKTFTMEGRSSPEQRGIIPRSIEDIFNYIENDTTARSKYLVRASYLQIYNEVISDLLKPERTNLTIREDKKKGIFVEGLSEWVVRSPAEIYGLMERGAMQRAVGSTKMNELSSRSHAVFIIIAENSTTYDIVQGELKMPPVDKEETLPIPGGPNTRQSFKVGKLNLVDLAGSERVRVTGATGKRLEESKKINQSLSALGNVISALTDAKGRQHVPYRDSKLTRILEDSLGGNCRTTMMAMVSPAMEAFNETLSTLKFANRAKNIKNEARVNEDLDQKTLLRKYERELKKLRAELEQRSRNLVDKRRLLEVEEQKRRAEEDKLAAIIELEEKSKEFMNEKLEKQKLEEKITNMQSQLLIGGQKMEETPQFRSLLQQEQRRIRTEYEARLAELERERHTVEEDKAQVDRYKQLLLKQRDIMIALTNRLNERDEQILVLQEELEAYDRHQRQLEDQLDQRTAELIHLKKAAMEYYANTPANMKRTQGGSSQLMSALGIWAVEEANNAAGAANDAPASLDVLAKVEASLKQAEEEGVSGRQGQARVAEYALQIGGVASDTNEFRERISTSIQTEVDIARRRYSEALAWMRSELLRINEARMRDSADLKLLHQRVEQMQRKLEIAGGRGTGAAGTSADGTDPEIEQLRQQIRSSDGTASQDLEARLDALAAQHAESAMRMEEKERLLRRYEDENQRLRSGAVAPEPHKGASAQELATLRDKCSNNAKERAALLTILDSKIRTLVDSIARSVSEALPEAQRHPRFMREVHALEKLVVATVNAMRSSEQPADGAQ